MIFFFFKEEKCLAGRLEKAEENEQRRKIVLDIQAIKRGSIWTLWIKDSKFCVLIVVPSQLIKEEDYLHRVTW